MEIPLNITAQGSGNGARIRHPDGRIETIWVGPGEIVEIPRGAEFLGYDTSRFSTVIDLGEINK